MRTISARTKRSDIWWDSGVFGVAHRPKSIVRYLQNFSSCGFDAPPSRFRNLDWATSITIDYPFLHIHLGPHQMNLSSSFLQCAPRAHRKTSNLPTKLRHTGAYRLRRAILKKWPMIMTCGCNVTRFNWKACTNYTSVCALISFRFICVVRWFKYVSFPHHDSVNPRMKCNRQFVSTSHKYGTLALITTNTDFKTVW